MFIESQLPGAGKVEQDPTDETTTLAVPEADGEAWL
jgi:hypothetical protein